MKDYIKLNYMMNQHFLISYNLNNINAYEITAEKALNIKLKLHEENEITNIEFNPIIDNIISVSYFNGTCKIYNILNEKDFILFEGIDNYSLIFSKFNYLNPNIIASMNQKSIIMIWDVRQLSLLQIIDNKNNDDIIDFKWSYFSSNLIEVMRNNKMIQLLDYKSLATIAEYQVKKYKKYLFLNKDTLLTFNSNSIDKIDVKSNKLISEINLDDTYLINIDLIQYNYLIILVGKILYIYEISSFSKVQKYELERKDNYRFFYPSKNNIIYNSFCDEPDEIINSTIIDFHINLEKNKNINMENIKNNFYDKYEKAICKYMSLLNFKENIIEESFYEKKYMRINEVLKFFNNAKKINIFTRKEFVNNILKNIKCNDFKDELSIDNFKEILRFSNVISVIDINQKKIELSKIFEQINSPDLIKELFIELAKLLSIDNTNVELLIIYLLVLKLYENKLIEYFNENNIEKFEEEINYYGPCFSKEYYKSLFDKNKESEKDIVLNFINRAYSIKKYDYSNQELKALVNEIENNFPKFNQAIDFDCPNEELKWHLIKTHIFSKFKNLELTKEEQENLGRLKKGLFALKENKLLENNNILKDKYKLATSVYLISNPCDAKNSSVQFICNLLLSTKNTKEKLEKKFNLQIKNIEEPLIYKGIEYKDCENLCLDNLDISTSDFKNEEKYNFYYLINKFEKKENSLKKFLKNILVKQTFKDAYNILFEDNDFKLEDPKYLEEFIDKRLKFIPTRALSTLAISDKISLNTYIFIKPRNISTAEDLNLSIMDCLKEILNTGGYALTEEHEIFHLLDCVPYYQNNCEISRNTPRKRYYEGKSEGGEYLELLLFDKVFNEMYLDEAFFILNEANYDKPLYKFREDFKKRNPEDLKIQGEFNYFNNYLENNEIKSLKYNSIFINLKESKIKMSDFKIKICLENDVVGRL